jgi:hypothetical protein
MNSLNILPETSMHTLKSLNHQAYLLELEHIMNGVGQSKVGKGELLHSILRSL